VNLIPNLISNLVANSFYVKARTMAGRLDASVSTVRNVLMVLSDLGLVEAKVRGLYEVTPLGERLLKDISGKK
jgi:Mn-dependent DtxR family transcriptional regulator